MGLAVGSKKESISLLTNDVAIDPIVTNYNSVPSTFYSDAGATLKYGNFEIQAAAYDLLKNSRDTILGQNVKYMSKISYVINFNDQKSSADHSTLKLQFTYFDKYLFTAVKFTKDQLISIFANYDSRKYISAGLGVHANKKLEFNAGYAFGLQSQNISSTNSIFLNLHILLIKEQNNGN